MSLTHEQLNLYWMATGLLRDDVRRAAYPTADASEDLTSPWADVALSVDGTTAAFRFLSRERFWVAQTIFDHRLIGIAANAWPREMTGLVTIHDFAAYSAGSEIIAARGRERFA